ncbi:hypothetical protein D3C76_1540170 [compost metagenome]
MRLKVDAVHVMASALHHQTQQQHQYQQGGGADGDHGVYRAVDQGSRGEDADLPAGFLNRLGLDQPGRLVKVQWLRGLGRVGLDGGNRFAFGIAQRPGGSKAPVRT